MTQFLLFDQKQKQLRLCRYVDTECPCQSHVLAPPESGLQNPRQLQLCQHGPLFASLEVVAGCAKTAVWKLERALPGRGDLTQAYSAYRPGATISCEPARTLSWVAAPQYFARKTQHTCFLCVLLSMQVLLVSVESSDSDAELVVKQCMRLDTGFPSDCFSWSKDGSQLMLGGAGQVLCFAWGHSSTGAAGEPLTRQFLCSGSCIQINPTQSAFLCHIEQKAKEVAEAATAAAMPALLLPGGQVAPGPVPQTPLIQEVQNNDGPPALADFVGVSQRNRSAAKSMAGLQVVPCHRYLLPLRCNVSGRLQRGKEQSVEGELLAVADVSSNSTCVVVGSFGSTETAVFRLLQCSNNQPGSDSEDAWCEWCKLASIDLSPVPSEVPLRLSGALTSLHASCVASAPRSCCSLRPGTLRSRGSCATLRAERKSPWGRCSPGTLAPAAWRKLQPWPHHATAFLDCAGQLFLAGSLFGHEVSRACCRLAADQKVIRREPGADGADSLRSISKKLPRPKTVRIPRAVYVQHTWIIFDRLLEFEFALRIELRQKISSAMGRRLAPTLGVLTSPSPHAYSRFVAYNSSHLVPTSEKNSLERQ